MLEISNKSRGPHELRRGIAAFTALWRGILSTLTRRSAMAGALEHLGSLPLTAHSSLALVRLHKETLLLGITPQGITLLTKRETQTRSSGRVSAKRNKSAASARVAEEPVRR